MSSVVALPVKFVSITMSYDVALFIFHNLSLSVQMLRYLRGSIAQCGGQRKGIYSFLVRVS